MTNKRSLNPAKKPELVPGNRDLFERYGQERHRHGFSERLQFRSGRTLHAPE